MPLASNRQAYPTSITIISVLLFRFALEEKKVKLPHNTGLVWTVWMLNSTRLTSLSTFFPYSFSSFSSSSVFYDFLFLSEQMICNIWQNNSWILSFLHFICFHIVSTPIRMALTVCDYSLTTIIKKINADYSLGFFAADVVSGVTFRNQRITKNCVFSLCVYTL